MAHSGISAGPGLGWTLGRSLARSPLEAVVSVVSCGLGGDPWEVCIAMEPPPGTYLSTGEQRMDAQQGDSRYRCIHRRWESYAGSPEGSYTRWTSNAIHRRPPRIGDASPPQAHRMQQGDDKWFASRASRPAPHAKLGTRGHRMAGTKVDAPPRVYVARRARWVRRGRLVASLSSPSCFLALRGYEWCSAHWVWFGCIRGEGSGGGIEGFLQLSLSQATTTAGRQLTLVGK